jgi:dipeptide/tripeptide permease
MSMTYLAGNVIGTLTDPIIIVAITLGYLVTRKAEGKGLLTGFVVFLRSKVKQRPFQK